VHTATNKLQERGGAIQEGKVHNSEERIKELEAPISRLDNDVKENCEQKELHGEHHPPVSIILEVEPLVTSCQGRMQLRFQVLGALVDFKYRIVVQHMDVVLLQWQEISFSPIDDSAPHKITADLAIMESTKSDLFRFVIEVFDQQAGLKEEMAMLATRDVSIPLLKREHT
jgi:hypothetical protein